MINKNYFIYYDYETISDDPYTTEPCEIGAVCIHPERLEIIDSFHSLLKPTDFSLIQEKALQINNITREELELAPPQDVVFKEFIRFTQKYVIGKAPWGLPLSVGHNATGFDNIITDRMCKKYKIDPIFHPYKLDTMCLSFYWYEQLPKPRSIGMKPLREFMGLSSNNAHRADKDCEDGAKIFIKYLQFARTINKKFKPKYENCFGEIGENIDDQG